MHKLQELLEVVTKLRDPENGCGWYKTRTMEDIIPHTISEAYEVAEAIKSNDPEKIKDELGDLLFQVLTYTKHAEEQELFTLDDVMENLIQKMKRRKKHVFGPDARPTTVEEAVKLTKAEKAKEKGTAEGGFVSIFNKIPSYMGELPRAHEI